MLVFILFYLISSVIFTVVAISYILIMYKCNQKVIVSSNFGPKQVIKKVGQAPGPQPWPVIGNLDIFRRFRNNPFEGFTALTKKYGDIYSLTLGQTRCLVVNNLDLIREVLNENGKFFGGRPNFIRYHKLFGDDRNNSLALCDWSQLQQKRRNLARRHCSPRVSSSYYTKMLQVGCNEVDNLMEKLSIKILPGQPFDVKSLLLQSCANMFIQYMCSIRFDYDDLEFKQVVRFFDEIFWEINQGYPLDFLPWLAPLYTHHIKKIVNWSTTIRQFIMERVINERETKISLEKPEYDFTDALLKNLLEDKKVSRNTLIFMLEDFIGGHSAVGNLVMLALTYIAKDPSIGRKIQLEADGISSDGKRKINLHDMDSMPYTMATIFEVLRYSSSPIVPHVATEDTVISGFGVHAGTVVFINNYILNTNERYWDCPQKFSPERFLEKDYRNNDEKLSTIHKRRNSEGSDSGIEIEKHVSPYGYRSEDSISEIDKRLEDDIHSHRLHLRKHIPYFLPFSVGRRTCIGQNLVKGFGFVLLANIVHRYNISSPDLSTIKVNSASIALPAEPFTLLMTPRK